jgi:hypothetical protein
VSLASPTLEVGLRFADVRARVRFLDETLAEALLPALAPRLDARPGPVSATVTVVSGSGPAVSVDPRRRELLCAVNEYQNLKWWERAAPLRLALSWLLAGERRRVVYAGAVGDDRGCVLLVGGPAAGKTTAALAAVRSGLGFVADDYLLLRAGTSWDGVSLYGMASTREGDTKTVVDVASLRPGAVRESLPVRAVVLPRIAGGRTRWRPARPATALRQWGPSTAFQMPLDKGGALPLMAEVVRQAPCFALDVGDDEGELAGALHEVLDEAVSS